MNTSAGDTLNCYNNTKSVFVEDDSEMFRALHSVCPWYAKPSSTYVCCDMDQINTLRTNSLKLAEQQLGRCPSCYRNFMNIFCATTCDPSNSLFMKVSKSGIINVTNSSRKAISGVDVYFTNYYTDKFFNSCKNVQNSQENSKAIDLMCGSDIPCTGQKWLKFMGSSRSTGGAAPFELNFTFTNGKTGPDVPGTMSARNATLLKCSDPFGRVTCSCSDCPAVCPAKPVIPHDSGSPKISFIPLGIFVGVIGFVVFSIAFIVIVMMSVSFTSVGEYQKLGKGKISHSSSFCLTNAGQKFEDQISRVFTWWGRIAAVYWFLVIPVALILIGACCVGLLYFEVTTDPVELWSAPNSRARKEKNYFDSHFGPFYRTAQIIIRAPDTPGFTYNDSVNYQVKYHFSGMFQQYILNEVSMLIKLRMIMGIVYIVLQILNMQNEISNLTGTYKNASDKDVVVSLNDICFQPLYPDNKNCTIYSVLNYFQNDYESLNKKIEPLFTVTANSSTHIYYCIRYHWCVVGCYSMCCIGTPHPSMTPNLVSHVWLLMVAQWIPTLP